MLIRILEISLNQIVNNFTSGSSNISVLYVRRRNKSKSPFVAVTGSGGGNDDKDHLPDVRSAQEQSGTLYHQVMVIISKSNVGICSGEIRELPFKVQMFTK